MQMNSTLRTTLLACLVLLGLQFLFPLALRATEQPAVLEECNLPLAGPEDDASGLDGGKYLAVTSIHGEPFCGWVDHETGSAFLQGNTNRLGLWLLPVCGLQPSAP